MTTFASTCCAPPSANNKPDTDKPADRAKPMHEIPCLIRIINPLAGMKRTDVVRGLVRNTSPHHWTLNHKVGFHEFRDANGHRIEGSELRALIIPGELPPGGQASFQIDLKTTNIPPNAATCVLDVVEEGVKWFADEGSEPIELAFEPSPQLDMSNWLSALERLREGVDGEGMRKLSLIEDVITWNQISRNSGIDKLQEMLIARIKKERHTFIRPDSNTILKSISPDLESDPGRIFVEHFASLIKQPVNDRDIESYARLFNIFSTEAKARMGAANIPLPQALCNWLNQRALPRSIASTAASRSMLATLGAKEALELNPKDGGEEQIWLYASAIVENGITAAALPPMVVRALTAPAKIAFSGTNFPPPTVFMQHVHAKNDNYKLRYDLSLERDRLCFSVELLLEGLESDAFRALIGSEILDWLTTPIGRGVDVSALEIIILVICGRSEADLLDNQDIVNMRGAVSWLAPTRMKPRPPTIRLIGPFGSLSGLGANMRMSHHALNSINASFDVIDSKNDEFRPADTERRVNNIHRPVDIFHLNLDEVPTLICRYAEIGRPDTYRIGFALWETTAMPAQHRAGLQLVDEIWTPTQYVADIYRGAGHKNVHVVGKGIALPEPKPFDIRSLGIPNSATCFLVGFDVDSWADRKNPMAAVDAFKLAFPNDRSVRLIVKSNGLFDHPGDRTRQIARLEEAAESDDRIILLSKLLPFEQYLGLIGSVTATVSPHRSEGFGYLPAYSMLVGRPTLVTDHSGTQDFCTEATSYPVRASLKAVNHGDFAFDAAGALWADIDVEHLAERMREVLARPDDALQRAEEGRQLISERYSMDALASRYRARLAAIGAFR